MAAVKNHYMVLFLGLREANIERLTRKLMLYEELT